MCPCSLPGYIIRSDGVHDIRSDGVHDPKPHITCSEEKALRHEVTRVIVWHGVLTRPVVPSAVSYAEVRLRRESSREECRKTSGIQVPDEPLELSVVDHSTR